jgi:CRISPR/Cas system CSM-associated protein Csm3 (group 7 of RAMP superfamily)
MAIGGPILSEDDWKRKFDEFLPRALAAYLKESGGASATETWIFSQAAITKLASAKKFALSKKIVEAIQPIVDQPFADRAAAEAAFQQALGEAEAKKNKRVLDVLERKLQTSTSAFSLQRWQELAQDMGLNAELGAELENNQGDANAFQAVLATACQAILPDLFEQMAQQIRLLQSDAWIDVELENRRDHLRIKQMLQDGKIGPNQWGDPRAVPEGVKEANWREFLNGHRKVQYQHMLNPKNLGKSITNDENMIAFLQAHRAKVRQELAQPGNVDFRGGGEGRREISRRYGKPYDGMFMRMLSWSPSAQGQGLWEIYVPGSTVKGAFRKRASQVLRTLWGDSARTTDLLNLLFGTQRQNGLLYFSDAYLADPNAADRAWCSMDGVRMDPKSGRPVEQAKSDYLFAYGKDLQFSLRIDLQDLTMSDLEALSVFNQLLRDFRAGDIPLGGEKSNGFGWVRATISQMEWLSGGDERLNTTLFGRKAELRQAGIWQKLALPGESAEAALARLEGLSAVQRDRATPQYTADGFISHREFSGYCGILEIEAEVLTPLTIQESGEPTHTTMMDGQRVNGWDTFSLAPPEAAQRQAMAQRQYALPSKSLKGMLRHIYTIASDSSKTSFQISKLTPVDKLFGWVGQGQNQALMGRLAFYFGLFEGETQTAWYKVPYPYGEWEFKSGAWRNIPQGKVQAGRIAGLWRVYAHAPLAPCVTRLDEFTPDTVQADYRKAIQPGARCRFQIRFWNLEKEELARLLWCVQLEDNLAHKLGKGRHLGFGSLRLKLLPESHLIDWVARYAGKPESAWRLPLKPAEFRDPKCIAHYAELKKALDAGGVV